jgi:hypothetical protein
MLSGVLQCRDEGSVSCYITNIAVAGSTPPDHEDQLASKQLQITVDSNADVSVMALRYPPNCMMLLKQIASEQSSLAARFGKSTPST